MTEYYKEMYAYAIDEYNIYFKCPFSKVNKIHIVKNPTSSLLNRELFVNCECDYCDEKLMLNVGDYTKRKTIEINKRGTSFKTNNKSTKRLMVLHNLEVEGRRQFNKTPLLQ